MRQRHAVEPQIPGRVPRVLPPVRHRHDVEGVEVAPPRVAPVQPLVADGPSWPVTPHSRVTTEIAARQFRGEGVRSPGLAGLAQRLNGDRPGSRSKSTRSAISQESPSTDPASSLTRTVGAYSSLSATRRMAWVISACDWSSRSPSLPPSRASSASTTSAAFARSATTARTAATSCGAWADAMVAPASRGESRSSTLTPGRWPRRCRPRAASPDRETSGGPAQGLLEYHCLAPMISAGRWDPISPCTDVNSIALMG